ncbi:hypothetical protein EGH90_03290 [Kaistella haifensis]|nr:hypothetical protein EGH90_03290 [Kaistella haifensis]
MKNLTTRQIVDILLIALLIVFIAQNLDTVMVKFLSFGFQLPIIVLIIAVFALGYYTANVLRKRNQ